MSYNPYTAVLWRHNKPIHTITPTLRNNNTTTTYRDLYFQVTELAYTADQGGNVPTSAMPMAAMVGASAPR